MTDEILSHGGGAIVCVWMWAPQGRASEERNLEGLYIGGSDRSRVGSQEEGSTRIIANVSFLSVQVDITFALSFRNSIAKRENMIELRGNHRRCELLGMDGQEGGGDPGCFLTVVFFCRYG